MFFYKIRFEVILLIVTHQRVLLHQIFLLMHQKIINTLASGLQIHFSFFTENLTGCL